MPPLILPTLFQHAVAAVKDVTLIALLSASAISLGIGLYQDITSHSDEPKIHWVEGFAIFLAVFIIVVVTAINNYHKDNLLRDQAAEADNIRISVRRNGDSTDIPVHEVLVGDVVLLKDGDIIPVDGLVIESQSGKCDESSATGESAPIKKRPFDMSEATRTFDFTKTGPVDSEGSLHITTDVVDGPIDFEPRPMVKGTSSSTPFLVQSGTKINEGTITCVALAVGPHSRYGLLLKEVKKEVEDTPLQKVLARLAASIGWFGLAAALAQMVILTIKLVYRGVTSQWAPFREDETVNTPILGTAVLNAVVNIIIQAVTVIVVAVPEGLPMAVTVALIYGTRKMAQRNNFVRQLAACETMGGATTICTDKTGTLTENKMTVVAGYIAGHSFERLTAAALTAALADPMNAKGGFGPLPSNSCLSLFRSSIICNTKAFVTKDDTGSLIFRGDKTEGALLNLCCPDLERVDLKAERDVVQRIFPFSSKKKSMATIAKADGAAHEEAYHLYVKGAAEVVLADCTSYLNANGQIEAFTQPGGDDTLSKKKELYHLLDYYAKQCLRCIVTAYVPLSSDEYVNMQREWDETTAAGGECEAKYGKRLVFLGIVGIEDPLRPGVDIAVRRIQNAGVVVRMVTGDNIVTATSIAMKAGILANGGICMEGPDFRRMYNEHEEFHARVAADEIGEDSSRPMSFRFGNAMDKAQAGKSSASISSRHGTVDGIITSIMKSDMTPEDDDDSSSVRKNIERGQLSHFDKMLPQLRVLARSSPKDKQILVEHLKSLGETVAVTGDGANDGPALKAADVGFAMGIAGSGIAKEAASIILLDDNFVSVVTALVWGRSISESVRKFLMFQLTVNVTAVILALVTSIVDEESSSVLTAVQLLWVNLLMDSLGALALATDEPDEDEVLSRPPVNNKRERLINWNMMCMIVGQAIFLCAASLTMLYAGPKFFHLERITDPEDPNVGKLTFESNSVIRTIVFNTFVLFNICNEVNCRRIDRVFNVFRKMHNNQLFMAIIAGTLICQIFIVQFGGSAFKTSPIEVLHWIIAILIGLLAFPIGLFVRIVFFRESPRAKAVKLDVYPTINPSWKRELLWRRAFNLALRQSTLVRGGDDQTMTITLPVPVYNNLKSALENHTVINGPTSTNPSANRPSTDNNLPLQRRPTIPMLASVVAGMAARRAEEQNS